MATVGGTAGNDFIHVLGDGLTAPAGYVDIGIATNSSDVITPGTGNDIIKAGAGDDTLVLLGNFTALDQIDGGDDNDTLQLNGDYSAGVTFNASTLTNVETVSVAAGHSYKFTTNDATVAAGARLKFDGSALLAGDALTVDASAEKDGAVTLVGGAGNDNLTGGAGSDFLYLYQGGNDTANGGAGDDVFVFFGTFTAADHVDGGLGNDVVYLHGNYTSGVTFGPATMVNVEQIDLDDFFDVGDNYKLTTNDATVSAGKTLTVTGGFLSATTHVTFDGSAETDGSFVIQSGAANDTLTGGAKNDTLTGGGGNDTLDGGGGVDTAVYSGNRANYSLVFNAATQTFTITDLRTNSPDGTDTAKAIEQLQFADVLVAYDTSGRVTAQTVVNIDGSKTQTMFDASSSQPWTTQVLNFDTHGNLTAQTVNLDNNGRWVNSFDTASASWTWKSDHYDASGRQVTQTGTNDNGTHWLTLFDTANQYAWSSATLTFNAQWSQTGFAAVSDSGSGTIAMQNVAAALDTAVWFTTPYDADFNPAPPIVFAASASNYQVTFNAATSAFTVADQRPGTPDGTQRVGDGPLKFTDGVMQTAALVNHYQGGAGNDVLVGNDKGDLFDLTQGGNDTAVGGSGDDGFHFLADFNASDHVNGGGGTNNQLALEGDYSAGLALSGSFVLNIQTVTLLGPFDYAISTADDLVAAGRTLSFWSASMAPTHHVRIDGSAETGGGFQFYLGQGDDIAIGGAGADLFHGGLGQDTLKGNGGADTFVYLTPAESTGNAHGTAYDTILDFTHGVDKFDLPVPVTMIDAAVAKGALDAMSFDRDLAKAIGPDQLGIHHAVLFTPTAGTFTGHTFLVVDANGIAGYQALTGTSGDFVFDVTGGVGLAHLAPGDFI